MATATIQLIFGVLNVWLPLMCLTLAVVALFLLYLHRYSARLAKAACERPTARTLPPQVLRAHPSADLRSPPVSHRPGRVSKPN